MSSNPNLTAKPEGNLTQQWLGLKPYLLLELHPEDLDDAGDPQVDITIGGMPDVEHQTVGEFCEVVETFVGLFARQLQGDNYGHLGDDEESE